jgi:DNA-binding response OmpR family regulator
MSEGISVLLVDDEAEFVDVLAERLGARGFDVAVAYDGDTALDRVREDPPAVMVLDLKMPGTDGFEVLTQLGAMGARVKVIVLTGHATGKDRDRTLRLGAFDFYNKPTDIALLQRAIERAARMMDSIPAAPLGQDRG